MLKPRLGFAVAFFALVATVRLDGQGTFVVSGTLTGPAGPLPGIPIHLQARDEFNPQPIFEATVNTDSSGAFRFDVPPSRVSLSAAPPPELRLDATRIFNLQVNQNVSVRMTAAPLVTIAGRLVAPGGVPPGARVRIYSMTSEGGSGAGPLSGDRFEAHVAGGVYSLQVSERLVGRINVDATHGDVRDISIPIAAPAVANPFVIKTHPRSDLISISAPDQDGNVTVSGASGSVEPLSAILLSNLLTTQINVTTSRADGSFSAALFAPPGSPVMIRHDPLGRFIPFLQVGQPNVSTNHAPATTIYVPLPERQFACSGPLGGIEQMQLTGVQSVGVFDPGAWHLTGTWPDTQFVPGRPFALTGTLTIYLRDVRTAEQAAAMTITSNTVLEQVIDADGMQRRPVNQFASTYMTVTGLPIERNSPRASVGPAVIDSVRFVRPGVVDARWTLNGLLNANTPAGLYRAIVEVRVSGKPPQTRYFDAFPHMGSLTGLSASALPAIRVGATPLRLVWMLGLDHFSNGSRGVVALEDRGKVAISSKVITNTNAFIIPLRDEQTGEPTRMRLEPYLPLLSITTGNGGTPEAPHVPFRLPSGSLTAIVRKPDGSVDTLGPAPFAQLSFRTPISRLGHSLTGATNHASDFHQLLTHDPRFDYLFTQWGPHVVTLTGTVEDIHGNVYEGRGTYEIHVARPIDFETALLPGTPFRVDDSLSTSMVLQPPVPAAITIGVRHYPQSNPEKAEQFDVRGFANRFGYFRGAPLKLGSAGEYRFDVQASWIDRTGIHWMGSASWGGVVQTPDTRLITRGRRGFDSVNRIQDQWLFVRQSRAGGDHLMFPFHSGDVMWMSKDDPAADIPKITVQDPEGAFAQRVRNRAGDSSSLWETPSLDERITAGEIPLFSRPLDRSFGTPIDQWGYFYSAVSRPGVRIREFISEDQSSTGYWRFTDAYSKQLGTGINSDLPNDFKFQFGGAVWRDPDGFRYYGGYASLFVLLPINDDQGGRVFPPFQGNGGGPTGGPLFKLKGKDVDLFFHPTALHPGTVLQIGETASFAGYAAPTLPAAVEIVVTSPRGDQRTIRGRASEVGYFYDPAQDFVVLEAGVWRAKVKITFDGRTSAGQVQAPYPTGDVLGSRGGEFNFYVVDQQSGPLRISQLPQFVRPADGPLAFTVNAPPDLRDAQLTYTVTMPGFILEEGVSGDLRYTYDAQTLARDFPNLDLLDGDGFAGVDTITMSFLVSGTDANGARRHVARQIVLQGEELQMPEQMFVVRRRAVRR